LQVRTTRNRICGAGVHPPPAGNDGELGPWYTSLPGTGKAAISVGSVGRSVTGSPLWNLANHGVNSTRSRIQNATIYVNGEEVAPIVSL